MITIGLDIGSLSTKGAVVDQKKRILNYAIELTSGDGNRTVEKLFNKILKSANLQREDVKYVVTTGYGRDNVSFANQQVTEITCHAMGAHFSFPDTCTVIDIGGQDSKVININNGGQVIDFVMNDKCAAGTGRFLEVMANALGVKLENLGDLSNQSKKSISISSMCTVFAESEVVSLVAEGCYKPDIINGVHDAIAERVITLLNKVKLTEPLTMTGGVAKNKGVVQALEKKLKLKINIPNEPQITGAIGAALIGQKVICNAC